jgi:hypothetical protein
VLIKVKILILIQRDERDGGEGSKNNRTKSFFFLLFPTYLAADVVFINHFTQTNFHPLALTQTILRQETQYQKAGHQQLSLLHKVSINFV